MRRVADDALVRIFPSDALAVELECVLAVTQSTSRNDRANTIANRLVVLFFMLSLRRDDVARLISSILG